MVYKFQTKPLWEVNDVGNKQDSEVRRWVSQLSPHEWLSQKDRADMFVSTTPFGSFCGSGQPYDYGSPTDPKFTTYLKGAGGVTWKGVKGMENVRRANPGVAQGLSNAIDISRAARGVTGVTVDPRSGTVPRKTVRQKELGGRRAGAGAPLPAPGA